MRILAFILLSTLVLCQEIRVLITKGQVEYLDTSWHKVRAGYALKNGTIVRLQDSSYLALVGGGRAMEFRKPGVYKVTLSEYKSSTYANKYSGYVLNQAIASGSGRSTSKTLGAVSRTTLAPIIYTPPNSKFFPDSVVLSWERIPTVNKYLVYIKNEHGQDIDTLLSEANEITYKTAPIRRSRKYYFSVATERYPKISSAPIGFVILGTQETDSLKNTLKCFMDEIDPTTCIGSLMLMEFLNDNQLYGYGLLMLRHILLHCPFIYEEAYSSYMSAVRH